MRCLHCNKKLSLLKLAKGDNFCSPEHFDAHQLQLSKEGFQRLMSLAADDTPKAPLVIKSRIEPPAEDAAFDRLKAFVPPPAAQPIRAAAPQEPPYATFAQPPLPYRLQDPASPVANTSQPVETSRDLAYPVHEVAGTVCILNLYLQLSLAGTEPKNWTSPRHLNVTPEYFGLDIKRPLLEIGPEFPEIENEAPVVEALPPAEAPPAIPPPPPIEIPERVPFLVAPSYLERTGTLIFLDSAASSVPNATTLAAALNHGNFPRVDRCGIPKYTRFAGNRAFDKHDSPAHWIPSVAERPVQPTFILPIAKKQTCEYPWRPSSRRLDIGRPPLDAGTPSMRCLDFNLPAPASLVIRPRASRLRKIDPQTLLAGTDASRLFLGVLETRPLAKEPRFVDPPACAMEFGWRTIVAPFPAGKPDSSAWPHRTSYLALPDTIASGSLSPMSPVEALPSAPDGIKMARIEKVEPLPAYLVRDTYLPSAWPEAEWPSPPLLAEQGVIFAGSTVMPLARSLTPNGFPSGSGTPILQWEPSLPAAEAVPAVRFLPSRNGITLPAAQSWPLLEAVPR